MNWKFEAAIAVAAFMGLAIQRGGTCTVAAIVELVYERRIGRLCALFTAAVWSIALIGLARAAGAAVPMPEAFALTGAAALGGALLGAGACVNRACVIGSVARLGSGDWNYLVTPLGFFVGATVFFSALHPMAPEKLYGSSLIMAVPVWAPVLLGLLATGAIAFFSRRHRTGNKPQSWPGRLLAAVWTPSHATALIGACAVVITMLMHGAWTYADALTMLAHREFAGDGSWRFVLFVALLLGAIAGGIGSRQFSNRRATPAGLSRCFVGGTLMAAGSLLVPGSNDGLLLIGLPMLWPYAWLAFASMCTVITVVVVATRQSQWSLQQ